MGGLSSRLGSQGFRQNGLALSVPYDQVNPVTGSEWGDYLARRVLEGVCLMVGR